MRTTIPIRGGLGDAGGYVYAGCFAHPVREYGGPVFPPYWTDAHIPRTPRPMRFVWREAWRLLTPSGFPASVRVPSHTVPHPTTEEK